MMLTTKGRYAVMAMVDLSYYGQDNKAIALHEISMRQDIAVNYLEQLFSKLKKENLVESFKGPGGGYRLAKPAKDISILAIVSAVNESTRMTRCDSMNKGCLIKHNKVCLTHALWNGLEKQITNYLECLSLEDVCNKAKLV